MVHRRFGLRGLVLGISIGCLPSAALAVPVNLTGNVEKDFDPSLGSAANGSIYVATYSTDPYTKFQNSGSKNDWISGWNVKDVRLSYGVDSNGMSSLAIGVNTWANSAGQHAPFGQVDGNPNGDPTMKSGQYVSLVLAKENPLDKDKPGEIVAIAGIPANVAQRGPGTNGFTVSRLDTSTWSKEQKLSPPVNGLLGRSFGATMPEYMGNLAFDPSPSHPQLEFTIANVKQLLGLKDGQGFWFGFAAGAGRDIDISEVSIPWTHAPDLQPQIVPEPATVLAWSIVGGLAVWKARRRKVAA